MKSPPAKPEGKVAAAADVRNLTLTEIEAVSGAMTMAIMKPIVLPPNPCRWYRIM